MTTYRGHDIDALRGRGGWRAYVDMHEVGEAKTQWGALMVARRYVDAQWRQQMAIMAHDRRKSFTVIAGGRDG